jgi:hypothetical protein
MSLRRLLGADLFHINIYSDNEKALIPFYLMMEKGILPKVDQKQIISMNKVAVGMKSPPDADFIEHGNNGHDLYKYSPSDPELVIDRLDCYWGGAPVPENDLTRILFNSKRRMTNFISRAPYGNVSTIPANTDISSHPFFTDMVVTDGKFWYDENNNQLSPAAFRNTLVNKFESAAAEMPVRVTGDVAWSAIKLNSSVIRVVVIDPGYLDPSERVAQIHLNGFDGFMVKDILSGEMLSASEGVIDVVVPMGIMRIIDLFSYPIVSAGDDIHIRGEVPDSVLIKGSALDEVEIVSQSWSQVSGPECTMLNADSFELVVKNLAEGEYVFRLTVTNSEGVSDSDDVLLSVFCEPCHTPVVNAGNDTIVMLPVGNLKLQGSAVVELGEIVTWNWIKLSGGQITLTAGDYPGEVIINDAGAGTYVLSLEATSDAGLTGSDQVVIEFIAPADSIVRNSNYVEIDGVKEEDWCDNDRSVSKLLRGWINEPCHANIMWDDTALYVFVKVIDNYKINDSGDEWWNDDGIEIFIDADNSRGTFYDENDFHFGFRWDDETMYEMAHSVTGSIDWKIADFSNGYSLEAKFPWTVLNHVPVAGESMGLEIRVNYDDDGLDAEAQKALFGLAGGTTVEPQKFGTVVLGHVSCPLIDTIPVSDTTGIHPLFESQFDVYPTVTEKDVNIRTDSEETMHYSLYNSSGILIGRDQFRREEVIHLQGYTPGLYLLRIHSESDMATFKIIRR